MGKPLASLTLAALLALPLAVPAQEPMRCGNQLIDVGSTKEEVVGACGEPDLVDGNRWYYDTEGITPTRIVVFDAAGVVTAIQTSR